MDRSSGWVEVIAPRGRWFGATGRERTVCRVRGMVEAARAGGCAVVLECTDGRWHVWIGAPVGGRSDGLLPFFKAVGSVAPHSCGVFEVTDGPGLHRRWVMRAGSVDPVCQPDLRPAG